MEQHFGIQQLPCSHESESAIFAMCVSEFLSCGSDKIPLIKKQTYAELRIQIHWSLFLGDLWFEELDDVFGSSSVTLLDALIDNNNLDSETVSASHESTPKPSSLSEITHLEHVDDGTNLRPSRVPRFLPSRQP